MIHLKLYEYFGTEVLFRRISTSDAKDLFKSRGGGEQLTNTEIDKIDSRMKSKNMLRKGDIHKGHAISYSRDYRVTISKGKDEYYYVLDEAFGLIGHWYECDTLDGLFQFIYYKLN